MIVFKVRKFKDFCVEISFNESKRPPVSGSYGN